MAAIRIYQSEVTSFTMEADALLNVEMKYTYQGCKQRIQVTMDWVNALSDVAKVTDDRTNIEKYRAALRNGGPFVTQDGVSDDVTNATAVCVRKNWTTNPTNDSVDADAAAAADDCTAPSATEEGDASQAKMTLAWRQVLGDVKANTKNLASTLADLVISVNNHVTAMSGAPSSTGNPDLIKNDGEGDTTVFSTNDGVVGSSGLLTTLGEVDAIFSAGKLSADKIAKSLAYEANVWRKTDAGAPADRKFFPNSTSSYISITSYSPRNSNKLGQCFHNDCVLECLNKMACEGVFKRRVDKTAGTDGRSVGEHVEGFRSDFKDWKDLTVGECLSPNELSFVGKDENADSLSGTTRTDGKYRNEKWFAVGDEILCPINCTAFTLADATTADGEKTSFEKHYQDLLDTLMTTYKYDVQLCLKQETGNGIAPRHYSVQASSRTGANDTSG